MKLGLIDDLKIGYINYHIFISSYESIHIMKLGYMLTLNDTKKKGEGGGHWSESRYRPTVL
jgi:hypothetical protein